MKATIWFHPQLELVYSRLQGELTSEGIITFREAIAGDPRHDPDFIHILDVRDASTSLLSSDDIRLLARQAVHSTDARRAIVASNPVLYAWGRMADGWYADTRPNAQTFSGMTNACQWLSIPPETDFCTGDPLIVECGRKGER